MLRHGAKTVTSLWQDDRSVLPLPTSIMGQRRAGASNWSLLQLRAQDGMTMDESLVVEKGKRKSGWENR